jgi:transcriptional regulator with XRE-family HTH domain
MAKIDVDKRTLIKQVRRALETSGESIRKLSERTRISKTHLHRVMQQDDGISLDALLALAREFQIAYCFEYPSRNKKP